MPGIEAPLMIFAAGFGTRMRELTRETPKPLLKVGGSTLLDRAIAIGRDAEVARTVVNCHYLGGKIRDHLSGTGIPVVEEAGEILDTGGGLRNALPELGGDPAYTLNPDGVWIGENPLRFLARHWRTEMQALLLLCPAGRRHAHGGQGDFTLNADGRISRGGPLTYIGVQILRTDRLAEIEQRAFSLNLYWDRLAASGGVYGCVYDGSWVDVGSPDGLAAAESRLGQCSNA